MGRKRHIQMPINLTVRLELQMARNIQELAKRRGVTTGAVLRDVVDKYMSRATVQKELAK